MKIALIVVENNKISEPYKDFKENHKFLITDKGFIYPFGEDKHIECYDARIFEHLAKTYEAEITTIDTDAVYQEPGEDLSEETFMNAIREHEKIIKYVMDTGYASLKPMANDLNLELDYVKYIIEKLKRLKIIRKYKTYWIIEKEVKSLLHIVYNKGE